MSGMLRQPSQSSTHVAADRRDHRIDEHHRLGRPATAAPLLRRDGGHEDAEPLVHLRRRQADAVVLVHGVDHVVDQLLHRRLLQLGAFDLPGARAQHRMAHAGDFQERHGIYRLEIVISMQA